MSFSEEPLLYIGVNLAKIIIVTHVVLVVCAYAVLAERKVSAWMQDRVGPNRVGYFGLLQPIADALKFFFKEDIVPGHVNKALFVLAPAIALMPSLIVLAVIPIAPPVVVMGHTVPMVIADLDIGILFLFAISSLAVYGVVLAGWASNSKYPLLGGVRASAQMISYELMLGLSVVGIFMATGTLRLMDIVNLQVDGVWNCFYHPIAFIIFVIAAFAETNRLPFDLPEAETELVAGYHTEYGSMKFAMFFIGEYAAMFGFSALVAVLFLGGWDIPFMSSETFASLGNWGAVVGFISFMTKVLAFMFLYIWVRWTIPRFRYDQLMNLGWKVLLPIALVNVIITGLFNLPKGS